MKQRPGVFQKPVIDDGFGVLLRLPASDVTIMAWGKDIKSGGLRRFIKKLGAIWFGTVSSKTWSGEQIDLIGNSRSSVVPGGNDPAAAEYSTSIQDKAQVAPRLCALKIIYTLSFQKR